MVMANTTCGICLDELKVPVSTPCGHLHCEKCLTAYIEKSPDAITASCPTCRSAFGIAMPDMRFVPEKYHKFIIPNVRRVFIDAPLHTSSDLQVDVTRLEGRVQELVHDKTLLMDRCEAQMAASAIHASGERDARLENEKLKMEMQKLRKKYDGLKGKYFSLRETSGVSTHAMKRKSGQAALDTFLEPSQCRSGFDTREVDGRLVHRKSKRPRLLGSPFDLNHLAGPVPVFKKRLPISQPEDSSSLPSSLGSKARPRRSGLPTGDLFSPRIGGLNGGHGSIDYDYGTATIPLVEDNDDD